MTETHCPATDFVSIRVAITGDRWLTVSGQPTACPHLAIAPRVEISADGAPMFCTRLTLTHIPTGRHLVTDTSAPRLMDLAQRLAHLDWDFSDVQRCPIAFTDVTTIVRQWHLDAADPTPAYCSRDDDNARQARALAPARTLLADQLRWWQNNYDQGIDLLRRANGADEHCELSSTIARELFVEKMISSERGYGLIYLLAVLRQLDPPVADIAASNLVREYENGDRFGDLINRWSRELNCGLEITLSDDIPHTPEEFLQPVGEPDRHTSHALARAAS